MVSQVVGTGKTVKHVSLNACLAPLCSMDRCHVTTVEGIGGIHEVRDEDDDDNDQMRDLGIKQPRTSQKRYPFLFILLHLFCFLSFFF